MPAVYGGRRIEQSEMLASGVAPVEVYAPTTRYAITLLGLVVRIQTLPLNVLPLLSLGEIATVVGADVKIGDRL